MALAQNIPAVYFTCNGATFSSYLHHHVLKSNSEFPFQNIYHKNYEIKKFTSLIDSTARGIEDSVRFSDSVDQSYNNMIFINNTFREIEGKYLLLSL